MEHMCRGQRQFFRFATFDDQPYAHRAGGISSFCGDQEVVRLLSVVLVKQVEQSSAVQRDPCQLFRCRVCITDAPILNHQDAIARMLHHLAVVVGQGALVQFRASLCAQIHQCAFDGVRAVRRTA